MGRFMTLSCDTVRRANKIKSRENMKTPAYMGWSFFYVSSKQDNLGGGCNTGRRCAFGL